VVEAVEEEVPVARTMTSHSGAMARRSGRLVRSLTTPLKWWCAKTTLWIPSGTSWLVTSVQLSRQMGSSSDYLWWQSTTPASSMKWACTQTPANASSTLHGRQVHARSLIIIGRKRIIERLQCVAIANLMQRPIMVDN
jgi:hypothetical protein